MTDPFADPMAWRPIKAPSLDELHVIAEEAYRRLPDKFRALCDGLVIHVDEFPTDEVLDELKAETNSTCLGLFRACLLVQSRARQCRCPTWCGSIGADPALLGGARFRRSAPSWPTCWCTRSATISASPTATWKRSRRAWSERATLSRSSPRKRGPRLAYCFAGFPLSRERTEFAARLEEISNKAARPQWCSGAACGAARLASRCARAGKRGCPTSRDRRPATRGRR